MQPFKILIATLALVVGVAANPVPEAKALGSRDDDACETNYVMKMRRVNRKWVFYMLLQCRTDTFQLCVSLRFGMAALHFGSTQRHIWSSSTPPRSLRSNATDPQCRVSPVQVPSRLLIITVIGFENIWTSLSNSQYAVSVPVIFGHHRLTPSKCLTVSTPRPLQGYVNSQCGEFSSFAYVIGDMFLEMISSSYLSVQDRDDLSGRWPSSSFHHVSTSCVDHYSKDKAEYSLEAGLLHGWRKDYGTPPAKGLHNVF
ncbi:hypothetical protein C8R45DRAFT_946269 [Mycena sanguinolenta]|nr:hypothetical protein C8R45DRAFT_946269 [Mycena sanguinolenta]